MIIGIVAMAQNFAIGRGGTLPWHYSADLKFFKQITTGNTIVMGRKTFASIGKPLPNRLNLVLSRTDEIKDSQIIVLRDKQSVLEIAKYLTGDVFIIGGASIYREFAEVIEKWIVTEIPLMVEAADAFLAKDFLAGFELDTTQSLNEELKVKSYRKRSS